MTGSPIGGKLHNGRDNPYFSYYNFASSPLQNSEHIIGI